MSNKKQHIFLLQEILSYFRKELPYTKMYKIEKLTQKDSFLEDAYDGLSSLHPDIIEADLRFISKSILRKHKPQKRTINYFAISIAASFLIIFSISLYYYIKTDDTENLQLANKHEITIDNNKPSILTSGNQQDSNKVILSVSEVDVKENQVKNIDKPQTSIKEVKKEVTSPKSQEKLFSHSKSEVSSNPIEPVLVQYQAEDKILSTEIQSQGNSSGEIPAQAVAQKEKSEEIQPSGISKSQYQSYILNKINMENYTMLKGEYTITVEFEIDRAGHPKNITCKNCSDKNLENSIKQIMTNGPSLKESELNKGRKVKTIELTIVKQ
ncbi:MAG: hypothetical protein SNJ64_06155 [Endomicrobiia bacterium]